MKTLRRDFCCLLMTLLLLKNKLINMINSWRDYKMYLDLDKKANKIVKRSQEKFSFTWQYLKALRFAELSTNVYKDKYGFIGKLLMHISLYRLNNLSVKTGISIPRNTFEYGLHLPHYGSIVVNTHSHFGSNCTVQNGVNVSYGVECGNNVYLGAGSKILKNVHLGSGVIVGANAVVSKSVYEDNVVLAGVPAKIISNNGAYTRNGIV